MSTGNQEGLFVTPAPGSSRAADIHQGKRRAEELIEEDQGRRSQAPRLSEHPSLRPTPSGQERASTAGRSSAPEGPTPDTQDVVETIEIDENTNYIETVGIPNLKAKTIKDDGVLEFVRAELVKLFQRQMRLAAKGDSLVHRLEDNVELVKSADKERMIDRRRYWKTALAKASENLKKELSKLEELCQGLPRAERRERFQEEFVEEAKKWFERSEKDIETFDGLMKFLSIH